MPHGLGGILSIGIGFWALVVNWWPFTELLLGLIPFLFVVGGLIAIVAGVKMVVQERRIAQENGHTIIPKKPFAKISEAFNGESRTGAGGEAKLGRDSTHFKEEGAIAVAKANEIR